MCIVYSLFVRTAGGTWHFVHSYSSLAYCRKYASQHLRNCSVRVTRHLPFYDPIRIYNYTVDEDGVVSVLEG